MTKEFFLEIGCEELPPFSIDLALEQLRDIFVNGLQEKFISLQSPIKTFGTPNRLIVFIGGLAEHQEDRVVEMKGPPKKIAFDSEGKPTKAGLGFARKMGVTMDKLSVTETEKGEYLVFYEQQKGQATAELLSELIPEWIKKISFPRSMRWGKGDLHFARPIRWVLAMMGDQPLYFRLDGLTSHNTTRGHSRLAADEFTVSSFESYRQELTAHWVIIDIRERERIIGTSLEQEAQRLGGVLVLDDRLLKTVARCSQYPVVITGQFKIDFLQLPRPVLITSMRTHQKFFALEDNQGKLLPRFLHVIDNPQAPASNVVRSNEKVLTARLNDAQFFFSEDQKITLEERLPATSGIIFHEHLGTLADKAERLQKLAVSSYETFFAPATAEVLPQIRRCAQLCKTDLATLMVGEFPDLQGIMGQEYALIQNETPAVAQAIFEHYLPRWADDILPQSQLGIALSIADKIDTLCGYFQLGLIPTGSEDPYALRRQTTGICHILLQHDINGDLETLAEQALQLYEQVPGNTRETLDQLRQFFSRRLEVMMAGSGFKYDTIKACLDASWKNPSDLKNRLTALQNFRLRADFEDLMVGFRRATRIIPAQWSGHFTDSLLQDQEEIDLYEAFLKLEPMVRQAMSQKDYDGTLSALAEFKKPIDIFFDTVLVMCDDEGLRNNRLSLLSKIVHLFTSFVDLTKIVISQDRDF
ncbi:glycine--tRNA ligase subunit beta [candidate division CSSED10-310 bacterium]|uniref:Glycine--tRNA ligase beta subunit n=1 Tax=candidate division CSSED10-310 bacterium TaxID=2855610 RepID=A0ABV6YZ49_UNCC1